MWIETLRIEGGVLNNFNQTFSANLNVFIGGRGTGKSSVIELLRFCLGATSYTPIGEEHAAEHALGVLGDGVVTVTLTDGEQRIEVSRTAQDFRSRGHGLLYATIRVFTGRNRNNRPSSPIAASVDRRIFTFKRTPAGNRRRFGLKNSVNICRNPYVVVRNR